MANPKFFRFPFGTTGDKTALPDDIQPSGSVSYAEGWGHDYERDPSTDASAKRIERDKMNQLHHDITSNIQQYQLYGAPFWYDASANGGTAIAYQKNATVRHFDGTNENVYISLKNNNRDAPTIEASWYLFQPYNASLLSNLSVAPFVPVESMTLSTPPVKPDLGKLYLVPVNATGNWTGKNSQIAEWNGLKWLFTNAPDGHGIGLPDGQLFQKINGQYLPKIAQDVQSNKWAFSDANGTANALVATLSPAPLSYKTGMAIYIRIKYNNTSTRPTLSLNGLPQKPIMNPDGSIIPPSSLIAGVVTHFVFDEKLDGFCILSTARQSGQFLGFSAHGFQGSSIPSSVTTFVKIGPYLDFDSDGGYDLARGVYVCPSEGIYSLFTSFWFTGASGPGILYLMKYNNTSSRWEVLIESSTTTQARILTTATTAFLKKGDTLSVAIRQESGATINIPDRGAEFSYTCGFSAACVGKVTKEA